MEFEMKEIPRYPGYFATKNGRIFSSRYGNLRELKKCTNSNGSQIVTPSVNNKKYSENVHTLILETFIGKKPKGSIACHGKNGRLDNSLSNLSWGTYSKNNLEDRKRDGTHHWGSKIWTNKLTIDQVKEIRNKSEFFKISYASLSREYGVKESTIRNIVLRNIWKEVK